MAPKEETRKTFAYCSTWLDQLAYFGKKRRMQRTIPKSSDRVRLDDLADKMVRSLIVLITGKEISCRFNEVTMMLWRMHPSLRKYEYAHLISQLRTYKPRSMATRLADSWSRKGIVQIAYTIEITVIRKECRYVCVWYQTRPNGPRYV